jgi:hypothetical protein
VVLTARHDLPDTAGSWACASVVLSSALAQMHFLFGRPIHSAVEGLERVVECTRTSWSASSGSNSIGSTQQQALDKLPVALHDMDADARAAMERVYLEPLPKTPPEMQQLCHHQPRLTLRRLALVLTQPKKVGKKEQARLLECVRVCCGAVSVEELDAEDDRYLEKLLYSACVAATDTGLGAAPVVQAGKTVLLALAGLRPQPVLDLLAKSYLWQPNAMPEGSMLSLVTQLLRDNPRSLSKDTARALLSRTAYVLGRLHIPPIRCAVAAFVASLCTGLVELTLSGAAPLSEFEVDVCACYEVVAGNWLVSDQANTRSAAALATGALMQLIPRNRFFGDASNSIPHMLRALEPGSPLPALTGLANGILRRCVTEGFKASDEREREKRAKVTSNEVPTGRRVGRSQRAGALGCGVQAGRATHLIARSGAGGRALCRSSVLR